jgi:hypothetical protein
MINLVNAMLSTHTIEKSLEHIAPELRDIIFEIRNIVAAVAPDATEIMHSRGMRYFHAERGGPVSAGICQILIEHDYIGLAFIHGAFLPDPRGLLEGKPRYKKFVRIYAYDDAPWDYLRDLIAASSRFDPRSLEV